MKKFAHIVSVIVLLLCVGITENLQYTVHAAATSERTDDVRETEALHLSANQAKVSKPNFIIYSKAVATAIVGTPPVFTQFCSALPKCPLYLRLRVLRN